jgi:hypothetical protein
MLKFYFHLIWCNFSVKKTIQKIKNLVALTKDNHTIWSKMNQPTKQCLTIKHLIILVIFSDFKIAP